MYLGGLWKLCQLSCSKWHWCLWGVRLLIQGSFLTAWCGTVSLSLNCVPWGEDRSQRAVWTLIYRNCCKDSDGEDLCHLTSVFSVDSWQMWTILVKSLNVKLNLTGTPGRCSNGFSLCSKYTASFTPSMSLFITWKERTVSPSVDLG